MTVAAKRLRAEIRPIRPAARITSGNGIWRRNSDRKASAATILRMPFPRARDPIRTTAWKTMATTAALRPKSSPATGAACPTST
jgi:hypothetical protein